MSHDQIVHGLRNTMSTLDELSVSNCPGVYALFLKCPDSLTHFEVPISDPLYIGMSSNLAKREFKTHFCSGRTGASTLRRSIGAILKQHLNLTAIPRGAGHSAPDFTKFCFDPEGEDRLTEWMQSNLMISVQPHSDYVTIERELIRELKPTLNLTCWRNPSRRIIKTLRKVCADQARQEHSA